MRSIRRKLRHRVLWERRTTEDDWAGSTYAAALEIPARVVEIAREVADAGGVATRRVDNIYVEADVGIGDRVNGEIVQARESITNMGGQTLGYKLYTEPVGRS